MKARDFILDHFDHLLLAALAVGSAATGLWADAHHMGDTGRWFYGQGTGFIGALLLRIRGGGGPSGPTPVGEPVGVSKSPATV